MSPRTAGADVGGHGGRIAVTILVVVGIAIVMLVVLRARPGTGPFDIESGRPDGTRGLVLLLRQQGATVDVVRAPLTAGDGGRLLVLEDRLDDGQRAELRDWVRRGGVAVVADPTSPLVGDVATSALHERSLPLPFEDAASQANVLPGECTIGALAALRGVFVRAGVVFAAPDGAERCFDEHGRWFVFTQPLGDGVVVSLGDNEVWTNALLRYADNAPLATALLAPARGSSVHVLVGDGPRRSPTDLGTGDETLADLVRPGVWMALVQLGLAFLLFAIARGIRPGRPVDEPLPVPVEGSELVTATGQLMQRARHAARTGWILRGETYRELCRRLDVATTTPIVELDALAARRGITVPGEVSAALEQSVDTSAQLVTLANRLADLRDHGVSSRAVPDPTPPGDPRELVP